MGKGTASNADIQIILVWPELCQRKREGFQPLHWTHFLPVESVSWKVSPSLSQMLVFKSSALTLRAAFLSFQKKQVIQQL